jgi:hypothetical protein
MAKNNFHYASFLAILWLVMGSASIAATPKNKTVWRIVDKSLNELLDSGWKIISHSTNRIVTSPGTSGNLLYDESTDTYILYKDSKYINCSVRDPRPDNAYSRCRQLN